MAEARLVNGRAEAAIAPEDRGLAYGDGLFETVAIADGRPRLWDEHMDRLLEGARRLGLPEPPLATLHEEGHALAREASGGVLKVYYTRGVGDGRGYRPPDRPEPTRVVSRHELPAIPRERWEGVDCRLCRIRLSAQPALAGVKHINRLEQVLARSEWQDPAVAEGLMLDPEGAIVEGTATNFLAVRGRALVTPALASAGVAGVMRRWVLAQAEALGLRVERRGIHPEELPEMDEAFLTNSLIGLWPVRSVAGHQIPVGPISRRYLARMAEQRLTPLLGQADGGHGP